MKMLTGWGGALGCAVIVGLAIATVPGWVLQQDVIQVTEIKLTASDAVGRTSGRGDRFGSSVALSGDTALVGARNDDDDGTDSGSAYIFARDEGGPDNWSGVTKLTASDAAAEELFGSVALSGTTALIGARGDDDGGDRSGAAYIFERDVGGPDSWGEVVKLTPSDGSARDFFGRSVALSGDTALIGADGNDEAAFGAGAAYIFERDVGGPDSWGEVTKLTASDTAAGDSFGGPVALSGDTAIVGAGSKAGDICCNVGAAYVFERNAGGPDNWARSLS